MIAVLHPNQFFELITSDRFYTWIVGVGLVLFSLHSDFFRYGDEVLFFPPQWGFLCFLWVGFMMALGRRLSWSVLGDKKLYIPIFGLILFIVLRCLIDFSFESLAKIIFTCSMVLVYMIGRILGPKILWPIIYITVIQSISVIYYALFMADWDNWRTLTNGGLISETNYAMGTAFIAFGMICGIYLIKNQWLKASFIGINILGMMFTGSPEALLMIVITGAWLIYKRDWNIELKSALTIVTILIVSWFAFGAGITQYERVSETIRFAISGNIAKADSWENADTITDKSSRWYGYEATNDPSWGQGRLPAYKRAFGDISIMGHGYYIYTSQKMDDKVVRTAKVHNVPLVGLDQIGIIGCLLWIWITGYCFFKFKWKAFWVIIVGLGLFNHTTWTVMIPYWWVMIGISSGWMGREYLFKGENNGITQKKETST